MIYCMQHCMRIRIERKGKKSFSLMDENDISRRYVLNFFRLSKDNTLFIIDIFLSFQSAKVPVC
jgi:hypothetical protein